MFTYFNETLGRISVQTFEIQQIGNLDCSKKHAVESIDEYIIKMEEKPIEIEYSVKIVGLQEILMSN